MASTTAQQQQHHELRRGIVFDRWPFRLDVAYEYQCWVLVAVSAFAVTLCLLPCLCGAFRSRVSKRFTVWVYSRLHTFFCAVFYFNITLLFFTVGLLPDWTVNAYVATAFDFLDWVLIHLVKFLVSALIRRHCFSPFRRHCLSSLSQNQRQLYLLTENTP